VYTTDLLFIFFMKNVMLGEWVGLGRGEEEHYEWSKLNEYYIICGCVC